MTTLTFKPTLLGSGGSGLLHHAPIYAILRDRGVIELTETVTRQNNAILTLKTCMCGCGEQFIATTPRQKYVDNIHRQKAYRNRNRATSTTKSCLWCGSSSMQSKSKRAKFCCGSCRQLSYRHQRIELIATFAKFADISDFDAGMVLETVGASKMRDTIEKSGYSYDHKRRVWSK